MQQTLTADEISELTKAFGSVPRLSKRDDRKVRPYDFTRPKKHSKSNVRAAECLFADLGRAWAQVLSAALKTQVSVEVGSIEEVVFSAYAEALPDSSTVTAIDVEPGGHAHLDMPVRTALMLANRLAGGGGEIHQRRTKLTQIEQVLLKLLIGRLCAGLSSVCSQQFNVSDIRQSIAADNSPVVVAAMDWHINGREHRVNLALASHIVDQFAHSITETDTPKQPHIGHTLDPRSLDARLGSVPILVAADLGHVRVTMQELAGMEVGDIIRLDHRADEPIGIKIGRQTAFHSRIGLSGDKLAVQIHSRSSEPGT